MNGKIRYIIEIEGGGDPGRKGIAGAILLADYCVAKQAKQAEQTKQQLEKEKFNMLFISCSEKDIGSIQARIDAAKSYCHWKNIHKVKVCSFEDFEGNPMEKLNGLFS